MSASDRWLTVLDGIRRDEPAALGCSFRLAATPEQLLAPNGSTRRGTTAPPRPPDRFVVDLSAGVIRDGPGTAWALSPVSVDGHCQQARAPPTALLGEDNRTLPRRDDRAAAQCFGTVWSVAQQRGRNVPPPAVSLPGPFDIGHC